MELSEARFSLRPALLTYTPSNGAHPWELRTELYIGGRKLTSMRLEHPMALTESTVDFIMRSIGESLKRAIREAE